ncbi:MAG TPA: hypothetical protein VD902_06095 [Symbiobacteriaceae bacterium]|nr:hypothetical protein [Symbiobacteriaceae bacterium]
MAGSTAERLEEILTPYLGRTVAQTTIRMQCKALNTTPESLSASQLPSLIDRLTIGLRVFVGADKANQIRTSMSAIH